MDLGLIGCGHAASFFHVPAIRQVPEVRIEAIADVNREQVERFRRRHGIEKRYTDHHSMLDECDIDSVLICTPPQTHAQIILDSIDRRLHVICEKPFVSSLSEIDLVARSVSKDLVVIPVHNYVFTPSLRLMENLISNGGLGDLIRAEARLAVGFNTWRSKTDYRTRDSAGVIPDLLYHVIYVVNRLCGSLVKLRDVEAERGHNHVVNKVHIEGELKNGVTTELSASWKAMFPHFKISLHYSPAVIETDLIWHPYNVFARGIEREHLQISFRGRLAEAREIISRRHPSFRLLYHNFVESVTSKSKPEVTIQHAKETLQTIRAVVEMAGV